MKAFVRFTLLISILLDNLPFHTMINDDNRDKSVSIYTYKYV